MRTLPIFDKNPMTSVIGVMHFPHDLAKAATLSKYVVSGPLRVHEPTGQVLVGSYGIREDVKTLNWIGQSAGEVIKVLWALRCSQPKHASLTTALEYVVDSLEEAGEKEIGISTLRLYLRQMAPVLHLWGARSIRLNEFHGREWVLDASIGYDEFEDVKAFLMEADALRVLLLEPMSNVSEQKNHFATDYYVMPDKWRVQERDPRWPRTGSLPNLLIPVEKLRARRKIGRPS